MFVETNNRLAELESEKSAQVDAIKNNLEAEEVKLLLEKDFMAENEIRNLQKKLKEREDFFFSETSTLMKYIENFPFIPVSIDIISLMFNTVFLPAI